MRNVIQEQVEEGIGRIPGQEGNSRVNTLWASTVPQCRPIRHRAAVLQSVRGERERGEGEGVQEEKAGGETHYCSSLQCHNTFTDGTTALHARRTSVCTNTRRERDRERDRGGERNQTETTEFHDWTFFFPLLIFQIATHLPVAFLEEGNLTTSQSVLRFSIQQQLF